MDRILIVLKKENGPRASSASALGLNTIIFKYVYWHMKQISGERSQDHWSSGFSSQNEFRELEDDDGPSPGQPSPPQFTPGWVRDYGKSTGG